MVNHRATTTSRRSRDVLVRALRSELEVELAYTARRGHATALAREATAAGAAMVVVHGGDGTVNEVVNGLMSGGRSAVERPALAVVPGGSTNVFARALGVPGDWVEAAGVLLEAVRAGRSRTIGLARAGSRYFTFCAGFGLDAAVVRRVEQARHRGRTSTPQLYLRATTAELFRDRDRRWPAITMEAVEPRIPGTAQATGLADAGIVDQFATVIAQNTSPWTYLGGRPIDPNPGASFDCGLDILALRALRMSTVVRTFSQLFAGRNPQGKQVWRGHDLARLRLSARRPLPFQVDGDYLGERQSVQLTAVPDALRVFS